MKYPVQKLTDKQKLEVEKFNANKKISLEIKDCIICKSPNYRILYSNDRYGINQKTVMCNKCGFIYLNPRMSEESLDYFYNSNLYRELYETSGDLGHVFSKKLNQTLMKDTKVKKPNFNKHYPQLFFDFLSSLEINYETVCEIGCGYGTNLLFFKNIGKKVFGIEPSKTTSKIAADNQINVEQGFVNDLKDKYDIIILKHVFEHLYDPIKDLSKIRDHTNKYLFIEVPGNFKRISSIQNAHNFYFTENTLHKIVTENGFKVVASDYCRETEFIFTLFEKSKAMDKHEYSYSNELKFSKKIYRNDKIRYSITKTLKAMGIYNILLPLRNNVLKILNLKS